MKPNIEDLEFLNYTGSVKNGIALFYNTKMYAGSMISVKHWKTFLWKIMFSSEID